MIFKTRPALSNQFSKIHQFEFDNLVVGGSSFTYNNHETCAVTWPYYLRDLGGFSDVLDCSMPGAGNYHISTSVQWALENHRLDPLKNLVIIMWSGNNMDDCLCASQALNDYAFRFDYTPEVSSGITGGIIDLCASGNLNSRKFKEYTLTKIPQSRAIENFLYILSLYNYLKVNNFSFVFLHTLNWALPNRANDFDIRPYLPKNLVNQYNHMFTEVVTPYEFALKNNLLEDDDFHPSPDGHLSWTKTILLPKLQQLFG
jgi:hypothetical protein